MIFSKWQVKYKLLQIQYFSFCFVAKEMPIKANTGT